jgi:hypothetical protein
MSGQSHLDKFGNLVMTTYKFEPNSTPFGLRRWAQALQSRADLFAAQASTLGTCESVSGSFVSASGAEELDGQG